MPQALILINTVPGSNDDLPINALVQLDNQNIGGEVSYAWSIIDQPPGPVDSLSATNIQNPTITVKKEGTYLIQLIVNASTVALTNRVVAGIRQIKTRERVPAAQEQLEDGARGWAGAVGTSLQALDALGADPGRFVGVAGAAGLLPGDVLMPSGTAVLLSGLPGQQNMPSWTKAPANVAANVRAPVGVLVAGVNGSLTPALNDLVYVRLQGPVYDLAGAPAVNDVVFVSDLATLALVAGTNARKVGRVFRSSAGTYDCWFSGTDVLP